jgi:hypothetical protein
MTISTSHRARPVLAAILAGPLGGAIFGIVQIILTAVSPLRDLFAGSAVWMTLVTAVMGLILGTPIMLSLGLAVHHVFMARGWVSVLHYIVSGAITGMALALVVGQTGLFIALSSDLPPEIATPGNLESTIWFLPAAALFGAACALAFWLLRRPDRDAANPATSAP